MMAGPLPFQVVMTGGGALQDFDRMVVPLAQQSLQQILVSGMIGALLGGVAGVIFRRLSFTEAPRPEKQNGPSRA
jgi:hypothetical protein